MVPLQILWVNLVTGALMAIPLGLEPKTGQELAAPPRDPRVSLIFRGLILRVAFMAGMLGIGTFLVFWWTYSHYELLEARTMAFCSIVIFEWLMALNARSDEFTVFKLGFFRNRFILGGILIGLTLQLLVIYIPAFHDPFDTVALKGHEWLIAALPGLLIFIAESLRKTWAPGLFSQGKWKP